MMPNPKQKLTPDGQMDLLAALNESLRQKRERERLAQPRRSFPPKKRPRSYIRSSERY
jgi:hypothetical protein